MIEIKFKLEVKNFEEYLEKFEKIKSLVEEVNKMQLKVVVEEDNSTDLNNCLKKENEIIIQNENSKITVYGDTFTVESPEINITSSK